MHNAHKLLIYVSLHDIVMQNIQRGDCMSIQLKGIYEETMDKYELKLIAGRHALDNIMYWLYITEDPDNVTFLRSGELVITTGVLIYQNLDSLLHFVKTLKSKKTCGLIINTGKYIMEDQIPDSVIQYCNENNYPLFTMPWHIHIYDISRDYYNRIFYDTTKDEDLSKALLDICHGNTKGQEYEPLLEQHNFHVHSNYRLSIVNLTKADGTYFNLKTMPDYSYYINLLRAVFVRYNFVGHLFLEGSSLIIVSQNLDTNDFSKLMEDIEQRLSFNSELFEYHIGVSDSTDDIYSLSTPYNHALYSLKFATVTKESKIFFDDLGVLKLIYEIKNPVVIHSFIGSKLTKVIEYDKKHNTSLTETLKSYLLNQGNITDIASECFCHRNTVTNRIEILINELGYNLNNRRERFELTVAFFLKDYSFMNTKLSV